MKKLTCYLVLIAMLLTLILSGCGESAVQTSTEASAVQTPAATATLVTTPTPTATPVPTPTLPSVSEDILAFWSDPQQYFTDTLAATVPEVSALISDADMFVQGGDLLEYFQYHSYANESLGDTHPDGNSQYYFTLPVQAGQWDLQTLSDRVGEALGITYRDKKMQTYDANNTEITYKYAKGDSDAFYNSSLHYGSDMVRDGYMSLAFSYKGLNETFNVLAEDAIARDLIEYPAVLDDFDKVYTISCEYDNYAAEQGDRAGAVEVMWWDVSQEAMETVRQLCEQGGFELAEQYENGYIAYYCALDDYYYGGIYIGMGNWGSARNPFYVIEYQIYYTPKG